MAAPQSASSPYFPSGGTMLGHPTGLFALFFAEMWERFSYYGMRALLVFYMTKGFLGYADEGAYRVYGAYTALVYMTPFFGGMLADRLLGSRRAVVLGGLLMATGHLLMTVQSLPFFYSALAFLIIGNGFFKPNISTIVGSLYPEGSTHRDAGFTIFYIGINLGAAMAPLLCGFVGETYGYHYGFGLATIGMLVGVAIFVVPAGVARLLILAAALAAAGGMIAGQVIEHATALLFAVNGFVAVALVIAAVIAFRALGVAGLPPEAGGPPDPAVLRRPIAGIPTEYAVYGVAVLTVPVIAALVWSNLNMSIIPDEALATLSASESKLQQVLATVAREVSTPTGLILMVTGLVSYGWLLVSAARSTVVERQRMWVALILMVFSMLFWAFFEQAGSSINNFTDRNVDRVSEQRVLTQADVGTLIQLPLTQEQLGWPKDGKTFTLTDLDAARASGTTTVPWHVTEEHVGMGIGGSETPASTFQAANPIFIMIFGLLFSVMWEALARRQLEPNTPVKFALGLLQLGLGFAVLWYGASLADSRGMVWVGWLLLAYLLHTTGELCLSPVGLSMITKLSPGRLVSTMMGAWFLATAFSQFVAGVIAVFTGLGHGEGGEQIVPAPSQTLHLYDGVFLQIAIAAMISSVVLFLLAPILKRWMHGVQ